MLKIIPHPTRPYFVTREDRHNSAGQVTTPKGSTMFTYLVQGTSEELAQFRAAQDKYYIEETEGKYAGTPILNRAQRHLPGTPLLITRDGRVAIARRQSDIDLTQIHSRAKSFNDEHIARAAAEHIVSLIVKEETGATQVSVVAPATTNVADAIKEATGTVAEEKPTTTVEHEGEEYELLGDDDLSLDKG